MKITLIAILAVLLIGVSGCGKKKHTIKTDDGNVEITQSKSGDDFRMEIKGQDGKSAMTVGDTVSVPDSFPKDVPILAGAKPFMNVTQDKLEILHLKIQQPLAAVAKEYQEKLKAEGWKIESTANMGEMSMIQAKKDNRTCSVVINKGSGDAEATVQLAVGE
ncbi:MAG: hypothetical protein M9920_15340 [Verrucomicrobiae bacterium]|nr:hypothetical protein [Verrucomicrobiae bacterium]